MKRIIAIVGGTGAEGMALAMRFVRAGARVRIGSRQAERAKTASRQIAERTGCSTVEGFENSEAVLEADVVVLTVPPDSQVETLEALRSNWKPGAVVIDVTVRLKSSENSAQIAAAHVPAGITVASAFHTLGSELLTRLDQSIESDVLVCSENSETRSAVVDLISLLPGARPVDAGGLINSRLIENTVQLLIALNRRNKVKASGIRFTGI